MTATKYLSYAASLFILFWVGYFFVGIGAVASKPPDFLVDLDQACAANSLSCGFAAGFLAPLFSVVLTSVAVLFLRIRYIGRPIVKSARENPGDLVETAGKITHSVVGRDDLCKVIMDNVHDPDLRRPHLLVGGVGAGKTAVLVRLTELLAHYGAVPVPIRLRDAQDPEKLNFRELAFERFRREVGSRLLSSSEAERVWRRLVVGSKIVVLADGLEECLSGDGTSNRDSLIRLAIRRAERDRLPLILTSRPHESLSAADAVMLELEPLSQDAALSYVEQDGRGKKNQRLDQIVKTADVAEAPLYLQITRELRDANKLNQLDTRCADRSGLRWRLLHGWEKALIDGDLHAELPLGSQQREQAIKRLSALACVALKMDRLDVRFDDLLGDPADRRNEELRKVLTRQDGKEYPVSAAELLSAATLGERLGLVEVHQNGVRFQHSVMQAYLGSRLLDVALGDLTYLTDNLENSGRKSSFGREFLIAAVLRSRAMPVEGESGTWDSADVTRRLLLHASTLDDTEAIRIADVFAAAFEIDSVNTHPQIHKLAATLEERWARFQEAVDQQGLEEAKLRLVHRFAEAARAISGRDVPDHSQQLGEAIRSVYQSLYRIGQKETCYEVRIAITQEIGAGGSDAFQALWSEFYSAWSSRREDIDSLEKWGGLVMCAWLTPLLVGSMPEESVAESDGSGRDLKKWLMGWGDCDQEMACRSISFEMALAQGFKYAANRSPNHPHAQKWARDLLSEAASDMLPGAGFWFSQLTLVQALALWTLSDTGAQRPRRGHGSRPKKIVRRWCEIAGARTGQDRAGRPHPFVRQAADLAVQALKKGNPERFLWIDESGVVSHVGSRAAVGDESRHLWIPPSTGWVALSPKARQLVADIVLLLNLGDHGGLPGDYERRLQRTKRQDIPPCLSKDRRPLSLDLTVGQATIPAPGETCKDGCEFGLCPYPPKARDKSARCEPSEAFCRRQQLYARGQLTRFWRFWTKRHLKRFWKAMAQRVCDANRTEEAGRGQRLRDRLARLRP